MMAYPPPYRLLLPWLFQPNALVKESWEQPGRLTGMPRVFDLIRFFRLLVGLQLAEPSLALAERSADRSGKSSWTSNPTCTLSSRCDFLISKPNPNVPYRTVDVWGQGQT
jgi:hypothetical protein